LNAQITLTLNLLDHFQNKQYAQGRDLNLFNSCHTSSLPTPQNKWATEQTEVTSFVHEKSKEAFRRLLTWPVIVSMPSWSTLLSSSISLAFDGRAFEAPFISCSSVTRWCKESFQETSKMSTHLRRISSYATIRNNLLK